MAVVENRFVCDLSKPVQAQALKGNVFSLDNLGSRLSVLIYDNGQPATISGSVTANCILPDGSTVNVNGGLTTEGDGSKAYVDVPQSCLLIPGILKIAIKCTSSSVITTLAAIVTNVYMTKTDNVITPSQQIINDWNAEISAAIATQNAAIANQDTKIDDFKSAVEASQLSSLINKTDISINAIIGYLNLTDGKTVVSDNDYRTSIYFPVMPSKVVRGWNSGYIYLYDQDFDYITYLSGRTGSVFDISSYNNARYARFVYSSSEENTWYYSYFENEGLSYIDLENTEKTANLAMDTSGYIYYNPLDDAVSGYYNISDGKTPVPSQDYKTSPYLFVRFGSIKRSWEGGYIYLYDKNYNYITYLGGATGYEFDLSSYATLQYVRLVFSSSLESVSCINFDINDNNVWGLVDNIKKRFKGKTFSVLGDSISTFSGIDSVSHAFYPMSDVLKTVDTWWGQFAELSGMTKLHINAIGGSCIATGGSEYTPLSDPSRISGLHSSGSTGNDPDYIFVFGGINDFISSIPMGTFTDDYSTDRSSFIPAVRYMINGLQDEYENSEIIIVTPEKCYYTTNPNIPPTKNNITLEEYVESIKKACRIHGAKCIDLYGLLSLNYFNQENRLIDSLHPKYIGMKYIAECIYHEIF